MLFSTLAIVLVSLAVAGLCCLFLVATVIQMRGLAASETPHRAMNRHAPDTPFPTRPHARVSS